MHISKPGKPREHNQTVHEEIVDSGQQACFLALLARNYPHLASPTCPPQSARLIYNAEPAPRLTPAPTRTEPTSLDVCLRLTNGPLAGLLIEARLQAGNLSLNLRLSGIPRSDGSGSRRAELKRELTASFEHPIHLEFPDCDAHTR